MVRAQGGKVCPELPLARVPRPENTESPLWLPVCSLVKRCRTQQTPNLNTMCTHTIHKTHLRVCAFTLFLYLTSCPGKGTVPTISPHLGK